MDASNEPIVGLNAGSEQNEYKDEDGKDITETVTVTAGEEIGQGVEFFPDGTVKKYATTKPQPEKRKRRYTDWKGKYFTAHGWNLIMLVCLIFVSALCFWTLKGNHSLQMELYKVTQEG